ncbi:hypothetical protein C7Y47_00450 [Lysinibacillus sphaericus]|uniref:DMT family transporter n=1 Tax=Lysinibacillus sphaericus TaxID=1421 RepID=A0A544V0J4_LYSSH|nr:DMT family transporter [Lysinibacillus sp. SDF0037]TQR39543.1 hypothetical protein C7Y47_00450 [Lysinibacillus sp. SDF0037]
MIGLIFAILAGALISLQSIFNAKVNENVGHWLTTITQLVIALCIDTFGLFGLEKVPFQMNKIVGIGLLIIGVLIFKDLLPHKKKEV